jgi:MFS family permease
MGAMAGLLSQEEFLRWGWRIPFLLSGVLIGVGLVIRSRVLETPLFRKLLATKQVAHAPLRETVTKHWREILLAAGARIAENSCFYLFSTYVIAYARDVLKLEGGLVLYAVLAAALCEFAAMPLYGILSDYWSRRGMYILGCISLLLFAFPYYALLHTREPALVFLAVVISLVGSHAILYSVQASLIPELFGTRLRYTGASLGYQMAAPLAGGMAPLIAASLVRAFPEQYWPLALYVAATALISLVSVYFLAETSRKDLSGD